MPQPTAQTTRRSTSGFIPTVPGSKLGFRRRVVVGFALFVCISVGVHFTMGPMLTAMAPMWRTPDVPDQGISIITLSRAKLAIVQPTPTPTPPPLVVKRTIAKLTPLKYLEMGGNGERHSIHTPARRTSMLSIKEALPKATAAPDAPAATDVIPTAGPAKMPNDTAQADTGANQARLAGSIQWGDDNPPRLIALAVSRDADNAARHARVQVEVGPDGQVISVKIVESSGDPVVDADALDAARKASYAPATLNGLPVHGTCTIDYPSGLAST